MTCTNILPNWKTCKILAESTLEQVYQTIPSKLSSFTLVFRSFELSVAYLNPFPDKLVRCTVSIEVAMMASTPQLTNVSWWNNNPFDKRTLDRESTKWGPGENKRYLQKLVVEEADVKALSAVDIFNANQPSKGSMGILVGGISSLEPPNSMVPFEVDADGDVIMQDIDDSAVTNRVTGILKEERRGIDSAIPQIELCSDRKSFRPRYVLVVDTSFILTHLQVVNDLVNANESWGNVVMIPWAVVMELDGLKNSNRSVESVSKRGDMNIGVLARRANTWASKKLGSNFPGLWGQMKEESKEKDPTLRGDDAILDCCRVVKEDWNYKTAILSNDNNLCLKALVYGIKAVSYQGKPLTADGILHSLTSNSILPLASNPNLDDENPMLGLYQSEHAPQNRKGRTPKTGGRTPRTGGRATPVRTGGRATPVRTKGRTTPVGTGANTTPIRTGGRTPSSRNGGNTTPVRTKGRATPVGTGANTTPIRTRGCTPPARTGGSTTPVRTGGCTPPGRVQSPDKYASLATRIRLPKAVTLSAFPEFKKMLQMFFERMEMDVMKTSPDLIFNVTVERLGSLHRVSYVGDDPRGKVVTFSQLLDFIDAHWLTIFAALYPGRNFMEVRKAKERLEKVQQWLSKDGDCHLTSTDLILSVEEHYAIWLPLAATESDEPVVRRCYGRWRKELDSLLDVNKKFLTLA
ncbi:PIN domain-containing protein [Geopyxis carbonaria]|nr:PIN domain-containing protein [Geopyxis carbonaria]